MPEQTISVDQKQPFYRNDSYRFILLFNHNYQKKNVTKIGQH